ncbi:MAG: hypothetical protein AB1384_00130 [Actinomycetota bacterium]
MLILWSILSLYLIVFFSIMALVGAGYLIGLVAQRAHPEVHVKELAAGGVRRIYGEDALKAA